MNERRESTHDGTEIDSSAFRSVEGPLAGIREFVDWLGHVSVRYERPCEWREDHIVKGKMLSVMPQHACHEHSTCQQGPRLVEAANTQLDSVRPPESRFLGSKVLGQPRKDLPKSRVYGMHSNENATGDESRCESDRRGVARREDYAALSRANYSMKCTGEVTVRLVVAPSRKLIAGFAQASHPETTPVPSARTSDAFSGEEVRSTFHTVGVSGNLGWDVRSRQLTRLTAQATRA